MGYPGKRQSKSERQLVEAERLARLLASAPGSENDPAAPPQFLDKRFAPALAVWNEYAPRLKHLNLLDPLYRHTFAAFCVWVGEFVIANEEILAKGYSVMVRTISGDRMPRENPAVSRRETAMKFMAQLSERFGFTTLDQAKLMKEIASHRPDAPLGLFAANTAPEQSGAVAADAGPIGAMDGMDSTPPGALPN